MNRVLTLLLLLTVGAAGAQDATPEPVLTNAEWMPVEEDFGGVPMVLVPAGCFQMGMTDDEIEAWYAAFVEAEAENEFVRTLSLTFGPQHEVCIERPFWLDKTEVTQAQFAAFDGEAVKRPHFRGDKRPFEQLTWAEARLYCASRGGRLPTEAEWEFAARGPDGLDYPWGDAFDPDALVWEETSGGATHPVGMYPEGASWVGALDMAGNVWEWLSTAASVTPDGPFPYPYDAGDGREDPSAEGVNRAMRGGGWGDFTAENLLSAVRNPVPPGFTLDHLGVRCARDVEAEGEIP